jgi:hypothetical protein
VHRRKSAHADPSGRRRSCDPFIADPMGQPKKTGNAGRRTSDVERRKPSSYGPHQDVASAPVGAYELAPPVTRHVEHGGRRVQADSKPP